MEARDLQQESGNRLNEYTPPPEGVIVKKSIKLENRKTVIYIADEHPISMADRQKSPRAFQAQRELYLIIEDLVRKYGKVPVVLENWPIGLTTSHILETNGEVFAETSQDPDGVMKRIVAERDLSQRASIARNSVGNNIVPGSMFAMLAYPDRVIPVGSVTMEELQRIDVLDKAFFQVAQITEHPSEVQCGGALNFSQARDAFRKGKRTRNIVDCYCAVRDKILAIVDAFMEDRAVLAPKREMISAFSVLDQENSDFVVVVGGLNHVPESLRLLDGESDVNYIVVSPKALGEHFPKALTVSGFPVIEFEDDKDGTCERRVQEMREQEQRKLIEELMRDDGEEI